MGFRTRVQIPSGPLWRMLETAVFQAFFYILGNQKEREVFVMGKKWEVDGFTFETEEAAAAAKDELAGINIIRSKVNMKNPEKVLEVYNQLLEKRLCKTAIGWCYLREVQQYLISKGMGEQVSPIPIEPVRDKVVSHIKYGNAKSVQQKEKDTKGFHVVSYLLNVVLVVAVGIMFYLATTGDSITVLNYENQLVDEYEHWEQELNQREQELNQREQALTEK